MEIDVQNSLIFEEYSNHFKLKRVRDEKGIREDRWDICCKEAAAQTKNRTPTKSEGTSRELIITMYHQHEH
jgi:hypothetical protein